MKFYFLKRKVKSVTSSMVCMRGAVGRRI